MKFKKAILEITGFLGKTWRGVVHWLEKGDLVPLLVIVSAAHYISVLQTVDHFVTAFAIGVLVDVGHFRTVRIASRYNYKRAKKSKDGEKKSTKGTGRFAEFALRWVVALVMTVVSFSYHLRFYENDWWLAAPMPLLIAALAYFAQKDRMGTASAEVETEEGQLETKVSGNGHKPFYRYCVSCNKYTYNAKEWAGHCRSLAHKAYREAQTLEVLSGELS